MVQPRILVAGIGNIFLGDDGFGVAVARRLLEQSWPAGVRVADFGIRGFDLAFAILDGYDVTILVDALPRGGAPGTLYLVEPATGTPEPPGPGLDQVGLETHAMNPVAVLDLVRRFGPLPGRLLVVGCEPETFGPTGLGQLGLSQPVQAALDEARQMVTALVAGLCGPAGDADGMGDGRWQKERR